jgi:stage V sporulation protein SpoVS
MTDKSYAQSIAGDLFHMIQSAKEQGVDVDKGFRNQALSSPGMTLTYLFLTKKDLLTVPAFPSQLKKHVRRANALAIIELAGPSGAKQTAGIHLIWTSSKPCTGIESETEMLGGIQVQGLAAFTAQIKTVLRTDMPRTVGGESPSSNE